MYSLQRHSTFYILVYNLGNETPKRLFQALGTEWQSPSSDIATINSIDVMCEKTFIKVKINFDRPFRGVVFSKGFFSDPSCVHVAPSPAGTNSATFEIRQNTCGLSASGNGMAFSIPNLTGNSASQKRRS